MKIASIYPFRAFPPRGGNHVHAYQLIRRFQAEGHEVLTLGDDSVDGVRAFPRTDSGLAALEAEADVLYIRIDANQIRRDALLTNLHERARRPIVWEVNAPANENLAFSYLGGGRAGDSSLPVWLDRLKRKTHAWRQSLGISAEERLRRRLSRAVSAAICVSDGAAQYTREGLGMHNVHTIPNGADHITHRPDGPVAKLPFANDGALTVLYAGSPVYPWQGLEVLEETMRTCAEENDPVRFVLLLNQQGPRPITVPNAHVVLQVPHERVGDYLRAVDCALVFHPPFFWSRWGAHGSPMKLFDYMACGCPVVASATGQLAQVVETRRNGVLFDGTSAGLRTALLDLSRGMYDVPMMGAAARSDVEERFNWHVIGRRTIDILAGAVATAAPAPRERITGHD